jgi:hypothetical protein
MPLAQMRVFSSAMTTRVWSTIHFQRGSRPILSASASDSIASSPSGHFYPGGEQVVRGHHVAAHGACDRERDAELASVTHDGSHDVQNALGRVVQAHHLAKHHGGAQVLYGGDALLGTAGPRAARMPPA